MVFKLPSARCLSKASRDGALSENMANADINASLKGISTSSTRSSAMVAKCSRSKRKSASAQRYLRPFGTMMAIATLNLTSSTCEIVPMRAVLWHSCLRKARGDTGVVTGIYRPPGIAEAGDKPAPGVAVHHREFFRHAHRVADGQDIAENGQAGRAGDLAEDGRVQIGRRLHVPVGRVVLIRHDPVET